MSSVRDATYDVHALRYASRTRQKAEVFHRYEADRSTVEETLGLDYYFWLVRNEARTVLVDCGFDRERAAAKNRFQDTDPLELLDRMGVGPEDVDHVVITHMHYDHVGNVAHFPHATVSMAREEYDFWCGRDREPTTALGGHTPGQLMVQVDSGVGEVVLASDTAHYHEELEGDRPFSLFTSLPDMVRAYDTLRDLATRPQTRVIAGHDPRVRSMFDEVRSGCLDLTAPGTAG